MGGWRYLPGMCGHSVSHMKERRWSQCLQLCCVLTILCLTVSASQSQSEWWPILYSVCVTSWPRGLGGTWVVAVLYYHAQAETLWYIRHLISFACNGTLQLLAISSIVRGSIYRYWINICVFGSLFGGLMKQSESSRIVWRLQSN